VTLNTNSQLRWGTDVGLFRQFIGLENQVTAVPFGRYCGAVFTTPMPTECRKKTTSPPLRGGSEPSTLFRDFAAECMELAQTTPSPEKRTLYLKMASIWHQMAQRWEKRG
jgi:hypothetical protein